MSTSRRDLKRTLGALLSFHIGKIQGGIYSVFFKYTFIKVCGRKGRFALQVRDDLADVMHGINAKTLHDGGFRRVFRRDEDFLFPGISCRHAHGKRAAHTAKLTAKRKLTDEAFILQRDILRNRTRDAHDRNEDGKIIGGAFLFLIRGREIDGDLRIGKEIAAVFDGGFDAFLGFLDGSIGKTYDIESGDPIVGIAFHGHRVTLNAEKSCAEYFREHKFSPFVQ